MSSDRRRRLLERQAKRELTESGPAARLLAARLRTGELARPQVKLAAFLGDPSAQELLGRPRREFAPYHLSEWGREAAIRAGLADAWAVDVPRWRAAFPEDVLLELALGAVEGWLLTPDHAALQAALVAAEEVRETGFEWVLGDELEDGAATRLWCAALAPLGLVQLAQGQLSSAWHEPPYSTGMSPAEQAAVERSHAAIRSELIPWALGLGDPVQERAARRAQALVAAGVAEA